MSNSRKLWRAVVLASAIAVTVLSATTTASADPAAAPTTGKADAHKHVMHKFDVHALNARKQAPAAAGNLIYNGGPVEHQPLVYLVFWGNQWDSDANGVQQYMTNFFQGLGQSGDTWSTVMTQYTDSSGSGPTFGNSVLGGTWVDNGSAAPSAATANDISNEANNGAAHFGVSGTDAQIFVLSPSGTSPDGFPNSGFCAWHNWNGNVSYTNMPYVLDAGSGCGANSVGNQLDGFSIVGGHEYAESITDPQPSSGWVAADGEENGDLCAWQGLADINLSSGTFAVQPTWSNSAGGCAISG